MMGPLHNAGVALVLKPGPAPESDSPVDAATVTKVVVEAGLVLRAQKTRGDRQFCERRFSDDDGREVVYREDHVLGLRVLLFAGPDGFELRDALAAHLHYYTVDEALAAAEAADEAGIGEKVATLGPLVALVAYGEADLAERATHQLLHRRIHDKDLAVRRAALCCASYLVAPAVTEILTEAVQDRELAVEIRRQLTLREQLETPLDYRWHLERAESERAAGRPLSALVAAQLGLALARRQGVRLHEIIALCETLRTALTASENRDDGALGTLSLLVDLGRFHEAEEVVTELLRPDDVDGDAGPPRLSLPQRVSLITTLLAALRGRGRHDRAAALLADELSRLEGRSGELETMARRHLETLL